MAAAADAAAAVASRPPPPLPLPPGMSVQDLPALLRPVRGGRGRRVERAEGATQLQQSSVGSSAGAAPGCPREGPALPSAAAATAPAAVSSAPLALAEGAAILAEQDHESAETPATGSRAEVDVTSSDLYLWMNRTDSDIARGIACTLDDVDALARECEALFSTYGDRTAQEVSGEAESLPSRLSVQQMGVVTQLLIDKLGCREENALERIGQIYHAAVSAHRGDGLGPIEFRGYVASVLTQIQRELEKRGLEPAEGNAEA